MTSVRRHLQYAIANAQVRTWPYPHIFVRDVFPATFYAHLDREFHTAPMTQFNLSGRVGKAYPSTRDIWALRKGVAGDLWDELHDALLDGTFCETLLDVTFHKFYRRRFHEAGGFFHPPVVTDEVLVTRDHDTFALGPHTDSPVKVATALFYVPYFYNLQGALHRREPLTQEHLGTSLYVPKDPTFRCPGSLHHARADFDLVHTAPYLPNSMFAFWKTDNSFHGVEPVESAEPRRLLIYDVRVSK